MTQLKAQIAELEETALKVSQELEDAAKLYDERKSEGRALEEHFDSVKLQRDQLRVSEVEWQAKVEKLIREISDCEMQCNQWRHSLEKAVANIEDEYARQLEENNHAPNGVSAETTDFNIAPPPADGRYTPIDSAELDGIDESHLGSQIARLEDSLKSLKQNNKAIEDYRKRHADYIERITALEQVTAHT